MGGPKVPQQEDLEHTPGVGGGHLPGHLSHQTSPTGHPPSPGTSFPEGQVDSLLSIISSQRERFRAKNQELEGVSLLGRGWGGCRTPAWPGSLLTCREFCTCCKQKENTSCCEQEQSLPQLKGRSKPLCPCAPGTVCGAAMERAPCREYILG